MSGVVHSTAIMHARLSLCVSVLVKEGTEISLRTFVILDEISQPG